MRAATGFLVAPLIGVVAACLLVLPWIGELEGLATYVLVGSLYAYPSAILIGVPLYVFMKRAISRIGFWHFLSGGIASALPGLYFVPRTKRNMTSAFLKRLRSSMTIIHRPSRIPTIQSTRTDSSASAYPNKAGTWLCPILSAETEFA